MTLPSSTKAVGTSISVLSDLILIDLEYDFDYDTLFAFVAKDEHSGVRFEHHFVEFFSFFQMFDQL